MGYALFFLRNSIALAFALTEGYNAGANSKAVRKGEKA